MRIAPIGYNCRMKRLALAIAALLLPTTPALAQGGWDTVKKPDLGLEYKMARDYEAIPVDPLEEFVVLIYQEELPRNADDRKQFVPRFEFVEIDHSLGIATPTTTAGDEQQPDPVEEVVEEEGEEAEDKPAPPPPINNLERYIERQRRGWELGVKTELRDHGDYTCDEYEYLPKKGKLKGTVYALSNSARTIALVGYCHQDDHEDQKDIWDAIVKKMKLSEPDTTRQDAANAKLLASYQRKGYLDPEFRVEARSSLPKGWKADDTDNYILVFSTKDEPLVRLIKSELEAMRKEYQKLFPALAPVTAVSRVRICKDKQEYSAYGGPPNSGGYWYAPAEELVFYDYDNVDGEAGTGKANSRIVLYHEAFHQYIYYSAGSFSPHSWFNEGHGDYFSGSKVSGGKVKLIKPSPWRFETAQEMISRNRTVPWEKIIRWSQREYYGQNDMKQSIGLNYAQGWSMIYFLRESKAAQRHEVWSQILPTYFNTLRDGFNEGLAALEKDGMAGNGEAYRAMEQAALTSAVDIAFAEVDFEEIELAWREYILGL